MAKMKTMYSVLTNYIMSLLFCLVVDIEGNSRLLVSFVLSYFVC